MCFFDYKQGFASHIIKKTDWRKNAASRLCDGAILAIAAFLAGIALRQLCHFFSREAMRLQIENRGRIVIKTRLLVNGWEVKRIDNDDDLFAEIIKLNLALYSQDM